MTPINRKDLKRQAREAMGLTSPKFWVVCLVYILLTTGVDGLLHIVSSPLGLDENSFSFFGLFWTVLFTLYSLVIQFGYHLWSLWTYRKLNPGMGSLIQGFSITGRVLMMEVLIFLRIFAWVLLLALCVTILILFIPSLPLYLLCLALIYVAMFVIMLRYAMAPYLLADFPDDGAAAAVNRSVEMMRGRKWELFKLQLSFLGWYLLELLLSGGVLIFFLVRSGVLNNPITPDSILVYQSVINSAPAFFFSNLITLPLVLWLTPYTSVAQAGFYDILCRTGTVGQSDQMPSL